MINNTVGCPIYFDGLKIGNGITLGITIAANAKHVNNVIVPKTWVTARGVELLIEDMTSEHIRNCITMLSYSLLVVATDDKDIIAANIKHSSIFAVEWTKQYAQQFLDVFIAESNKRLG